MHTLQSRGRGPFAGPPDSPPRDALAAGTGPRGIVAQGEGDGSRDESDGTAADAYLCLVVGTSAVVHPAAGIATVTLRAGGRLLEVNTEPTPLSEDAAVSLRRPAAEAVPRLIGES